MRIINIFLAVALCSFLVVGCSKYSKIEKSKDTTYKLTKADEFYGKGQYRKAQQLYEGLFSAYKGTDKFEDLYYKWAYSYYYQGLYEQAESYFKSFLETFPNSKRAEEVDYMKAYSYYKQSPKLELEQINTIKAMNMMKIFISNHPRSERVAEATRIIDESRQKLELKDYRSAQLYFDLKHYRASAIAFADITNNFPESGRGEDYKLMVVKSYYKFAKLSIKTKQEERYQKVIEEYEDFTDRYPESKLLKQAGEYKDLSINHIKDIKEYEQITSSAKR